MAKSSHISVFRQLCELWNWTNKSLHPYEKALRGMNQKLDSEINSNPVVKIAFLGYLIILISCVKMKKYSLQQGYSYNSAQLKGRYQKILYFSQSIYQTAIEDSTKGCN